MAHFPRERGSGRLGFCQGMDRTPEILSSRPLAIFAVLALVLFSRHLQAPLRAVV